MKKILPIILTAGAVLAAWALFKRNAANKLKVYFQSIRVKKAKGGIIPDFYAKFLLVNGTNTPLTVTSIVGDLIIAGEVVSNVQQLQRLEIPANSNSTLELKITTPIINAAQIAYKLLTQPKKLVVTFEGTVNANGVLIPVEQQLL